MPPDLPVTRVVTEVEARLDPGPWDWAEANRAAIAEAGRAASPRCLRSITVPC